MLVPDTRCGLFKSGIGKLFGWSHFAASISILLAALMWRYSMALHYYANLAVLLAFKARSVLV